jgi:hypothetical protein
MIEIKEILEEWKKDSQMDLVNIDVYSANLSNLHSKYLNIYSEYREYRRKLVKKFDSYKNEITEYYRCNRNSKEDLARLNRKPCQSVVSRDNMDRTIFADTEFANMNEKMQEIDDVIEILKSILDKILKTSFDVKNIIAFLNFKNGVV